MRGLERSEERVRGQRTKGDGEGEGEVEMYKGYGEERI